ncbi:peptidase inhibitor family I36 protein [Streptomyces bacillaris]|uniref:peptidase inhibitor family I36 protein n=1 Tax=Streptomyces bacillaris TaxID=68179 RepID=UPI001133BA82|nr:hypothetical protein EQG64_13215 [Streptomyces sp. S6]
MRRTRALVPVLALLALAASATTATASPIPPASLEVGFATPEEEARLQQRLAETKPVIATYNGRKINLADGWQGAQACSEVPSGEVHCYDTTEKADQALAAIASTTVRSPESGGSSAKPGGAFGPAAIEDCAYGYVCLWEHANYAGRRLQWSAPGVKQLKDWNFRDQASSACVNRDRYGVLAYDARTGLPDPYVTLAARYCAKFTNASYPTGGTFNDKVDYIEM